MSEEEEERRFTPAEVVLLYAQIHENTIHQALDQLIKQDDVFRDLRRKIEGEMSEQEVMVRLGDEFDLRIDEARLQLAKFERDQLDETDLN